jgi:hypothetical protein
VRIAIVAGHGDDRASAINAFSHEIRAERNDKTLNNEKGQHNARDGRSPDVAPRCPYPAHLDNRHCRLLSCQALAHKISALSPPRHDQAAAKLPPRGYADPGCADNEGSAKQIARACQNS